MDWWARWRRRKERRVLCLCKLEGGSKRRLLGLLLPFPLVGLAVTAMVVAAAADTAMALVVVTAATL